MTTYNGWTNYETWNVNLWLTNDEGSYDMLREMVRDYPKTHQLMDALKDMVEEMAPDLGATMYADLLGAAIGSVNWHELATHYQEDFAEETDEA